MIQDIVESLGSQAYGLVETGKIKIGGKAARERQSTGGGTWRAPEKHDYFTITTLNRDTRGDLIPDTAVMDQLLKEHGDPDGKLRRIPICVLSDDLDDVMQSAFVWYGSKSVGARSDGKRVTWFYDPKTRQRYDPPLEEDWTPDLAEWKDAKGNKLFKIHTNFNCVVAAQEARWGGVYKFRTTSVISFRQLHASLLHLTQLTGGMLVGMPLMLVVRPIQVAPEGKPTTVHVVHVELRGGDLLKLQQNALQMAQFRLTFRDQIQKTQVQYKKLLALPGHEGDAEAAEIQGEFVSEASDVPDVMSVPANKPYGLLDDAPTVVPPVPEVQAAPVAAPEPVTDADPPADYSSLPEAVLPAPTEAYEDGTEGGAVAVLTQPPQVQADLSLVEPWSKFMNTINEMAIDANVAPSKVNVWLKRLLLKEALIGKEERTTTAWRLERLREMRDGKAG